MDIKAEKEESADSKCKHTSHDKRCKIFSRNLSADDFQTDSKQRKKPKTIITNHQKSKLQNCMKDKQTKVKQKKPFVNELFR